MLDIILCGCQLVLVVEKPFVKFSLPNLRIGGFQFGSDGGHAEHVLVLLVDFSAEAALYVQFLCCNGLVWPTFSPEYLCVIGQVLFHTMLPFVQHRKANSGIQIFNTVVIEIIGHRNQRRRFIEIAHSPKAPSAYQAI